LLVGQPEPIFRKHTESETPFEYVFDIKHTCFTSHMSYIACAHAAKVSGPDFSRISKSASSPTVSSPPTTLVNLKMQPSPVLALPRRGLISVVTVWTAGNLANCSAPPAQATRKIEREDGSEAVAYELPVDLRLLAVQGSFPSAWVSDFKKSQHKTARVHVTNRAQPLDVFEDIETQVTGKAIKKRGGKSRKIDKHGYDLATLGDVWVGPAMARGLLSPIPGARDSDWWSSLPPKLQQTCTRNRQGFPDANGEICAVPYRWGCTMMAFRRDKLSQRKIPWPVDWDDLWRPELAGRVAMIDAPREVIGAALKSQGLGYNPAHIDDVGALRNRLRELVKQVLL